MYTNTYPCEAANFKWKENLELLRNYYNTTFDKELNPQISKMLDIFHDSFRMSTKELKLVQRVTMMEMLVEGRTRITEKLAITVAKFLGKNFTKYNEIKEKTKTVYDARCRYLHDGNTTIIDSSIAQDALDLSRRILVNLFYINLRYL